MTANLRIEEIAANLTRVKLIVPDVYKAIFDIRELKTDDLDVICDHDKPGMSVLAVLGNGKPALIEFKEPQDIRLSDVLQRHMKHPLVSKNPNLTISKYVVITQPVKTGVVISGCLLKYMANK